MLKKSMIAAVILAALSAAPVMATGIPVMDVASIYKMAEDAVQQAKQALAQLDQAKAAISQAKSQYEDYKGIATGNDKLGAFLNDPALNQFLPMKDWQEVYNNGKDIASLRDRYDLKSDNPQVQAAFDKLLAQAGALEDAYNASSERVDNAAKMREKLNEAVTPQQKSDLQARFQQESLELQNQNMRLQNMQMLMDQKAKIEDAKRAQDFKDYMYGKRKDIPQYGDE